MKKITLIFATLAISLSLASAESKKDRSNHSHHKMMMDNVCMYGSEVYTEGATIKEEALVCGRDLNEKIVWKTIKS
jgi:hypothetical protein